MTTIEPPDDSSVIRSDRVGSFPWSVLHDRHPALVEQVASGLPYPPDIQSGLRQLAAGLHDPSWYEKPFLVAEDEFYRALLDAVRYAGDGPWRGVDPFGPVKRAELASPAAAEELEALGGLHDDLPGLLRASLWGNRADLSFLLTRAATEDNRLLVDDTEAVVEQMQGGRFSVVADNAGRELLADLALIDHLLRTGRASSLTLHVKPTPCFVSDALLSDVLAALDRMDAAQPDMARRLREGLRHAQWEIHTHPFWSSAGLYSELPASLGDELASSSIVILKGDLNYRRLVGDRHWPVTDSFAVRTQDFPAPVVALRTCKSEVVVGLSEPLPVEERVSGRFGLIQYRP